MFGDDDEAPPRIRDRVAALPFGTCLVLGALLLATPLVLTGMALCHWVSDLRSGPWIAWGDKDVPFRQITRPAAPPPPSAPALAEPSDAGDGVEGPEVALPDSPPPEDPSVEPQPWPPEGPPLGPRRDDAPRLIIPVLGVGVEDLYDSWGDARSGGRRHEGIDIHAPRHQPVLAATDGTILKLFESRRGGLTIYQRGPAGRYLFYYAHLEAYADGLEEGQEVRQGEVIATVGTSGNAAEDAPHLHFSVEVLPEGGRWWEGEAVNPYPLLK